MSYGIPSDWSRQYLAYIQGRPETSNDIWLLPLAGERKPTPFLQSRFTEFHAQFSPDGQWLAFTSDEAGRQDVYVQSLRDPNSRRLVSSAGGGYPRWSTDGRELFYRAADGRLMSAPVRVVGSSLEFGTPTALMRLVTPPAVHPYPYDVAKDGRILALVPATGSAEDLNLTVLMNWQTALGR